MTITINGTTGISGVDGSSATPAMQGADTNTGISYGTDTVTINTGGVARVTTDASGNVGIGTDSPEEKLDIGFSTFNSKILLRRNLVATGFGLGQGELIFGSYTTGTTVGRSSAIRGSSGSAHSATDSSGQLSFYTTPTGSTTLAERARIDSLGNLLVGTTSAAWAGKVSIQSDSNSYFPLALNNTASGSASFVVLDIYRAGTRTGSIQNTNTTTSYVTSSDYRLKHDIQPMTGALDKVAQLNPVTYKWNADDSDGQGFIAHELQAVVPDCVTGEKDAVETVDDFDDEGNKIGTKEVPRYQGVDTSFLVATLVAAIQELKSEFDAYKATHP
jgi:hypothetical protein